jgi:KDO2-lipid IV(A) lauroyltransferase
MYWRLNSQRRETVTENLLPALAGDYRRASALSRELFRNFAIKLADLWRYESGLQIEHLVLEWRGWEHFEAARKPGQGLLLITPHLGNWELGAPWLAQRGIRLLVITLQEPDPTLTELRKASRARWGIETLVIGTDPFAFVEIIRRLESGAVVALLIDRPPSPTAVLVELFGRPFAASIAAAELARATGCVLLPVCVPRLERGYRAEVLPPISYARAELGSRAAREALTQQIMRAFEPVILQNLAQWYHFVPIWPPDQPIKKSANP